MQAANYGMSTPHGYRKALRLMKIAERFGIPVVTLVDTCGALPNFAAETDGQSESIATNLTAMAGLRVPIVTLIVGEGGSGGALGIGMGNVVGMLSPRTTESFHRRVLRPSSVATRTMIKLSVSQDCRALWRCREDICSATEGARCH